MYKRLIPFALAVGLAAAALAQPPMRFNAHLIGFNAAGQPIETNASGQASVEIIDDGTAVAFQLQVAGIRNLFMAHIHISPNPVQITDPAGPIALWFTGGPPPSTTVTGRVDGNLAQGYVITNGDLVSWDPADPNDGTVQGLTNAITEGRASVVVHTNDLDPETPTGRAGDSAAGEIRGTLQ